MSDLPKETKRAIVADDDEFFRLAMGAILTRHLGFTEIIETASLDEAFSRLGETDGRIDLALFDLEMPGMAGAASLSAVRECFPNVRAAVVTASTRRRDVLLALEAGSHGFISKGSGIAEMTKAVATIMSGGIFVPPWLAEAPPTDQPSALRAEATDRSPAGGDAPPETKPDVLDGLTRRQRDVLQLIVAGRSNKEVARAMTLSEGTVKVHVAALLRALKVGNRAAAAAAGVRLLGRAA